VEPRSYLLEALKQAESARDLGEVPVGAVVVSEGRIIGSGFNTRETGMDPLGHAEIAALRGASKELGSWRLLDCDLYVTLEPCPMCLAACQQARIRKVVYGAKDEKGGALCLGFHVHEDERLNHRFEVVHEPMEECSRILKAFFLKRRTELKSAKLKK
jgi:tRNA(adenine34) deaminase